MSEANKKLVRKIDRVREYLDTMHTNAIFCTP
jgi:hypothetical protein